MKKLGRNEPCPCGSGLKYKECCWTKAFTWMQDEHGQIHKSVPLSPEIVEMLDQSRKGQTSESGKEADANAPFFPEFSDPKMMEEAKQALINAMEASGADPAFVYAFEKTGLIVSEENRELISERDLAEWESAVEEYRARKN